MRRGWFFLGAAVLAGACSLPSLHGPPPDQQQGNVTLTVDIVAQVWVGHSTAAVYTFARDGTFTAEGVPTGAFDTGASPFSKSVPHGPYKCSGTWVIGKDPGELTLRFARIEDPQGRRPLAGKHELQYHAVFDSTYPQFPVMLYHDREWMAPR